MPTWWHACDGGDFTLKHPANLQRLHHLKSCAKKQQKKQRVVQGFEFLQSHFPASCWWSVWKTSQTISYVARREAVRGRMPGDVLIQEFGGTLKSTERINNQIKCSHLVFFINLAAALIISCSCFFCFCFSEVLISLPLQPWGLLSLLSSSLSVSCPKYHPEMLHMVSICW